MDDLKIFAPNQKQLDHLLALIKEHRITSNNNVTKRFLALKFITESGEILEKNPMIVKRSQIHKG